MAIERLISNSRFKRAFGVKVSDPRAQEVVHSKISRAESREELFDERSNYFQEQSLEELGRLRQIALRCGFVTTSSKV